VDFRLTGEQEAFRRAVARFVEAEVVPVADRLDQAGEFPRELFRKLGAQGYLGLRYPEAYGGGEADFVTYCLFAEELARGSMSLAALAAMQGLMGTHFVFRHGSEALRQRYLVPALRGEKVATFGLTEPGAGSDVGNIQTLAERVDGGWRLTGTKTWVTNAPVADMLTVAAKTSRERGLKHIALFLVDRAYPGVTVGKRIDKQGVRASATGEIVLEGVVVPDEHLLGGETGGVEEVGGILSEIRVMTGALAVGLGRAAYEAALRYSRERVTFGKPIGEHQAIAFKLADMVAQLHAATLLVYHGAWAIDQAPRGDAARALARDAAVAKLLATEAANRICDEASRVFASYSFATEYPVERYFRDARFLLWGGGTSEILRVIIGRELDRPVGAPALAP
jgi:alkylation response protein AidB-like acyl-CoA dehydrogenase